MPSDFIDSRRPNQGQAITFTVVVFAGLIKVERQAVRFGLANCDNNWRYETAITSKTCGNVKSDSLPGSGQ